MAPPSSKPGSSSFEGEFAPGAVIVGRYRVIALVGQGGMGHVYVADDLVLGQSVALKFLPPQIAEREGGLDRFRAEVRHAREVTHPNVARVHDIGEVHGRHFLSMEFVDGEDLASLVRRIGRLPREKADEIAQQICAGLAEAHRRGVLHRDLKPANVMLDGEGRVKLTDFGLSVTIEASATSALAGTPQYMAPEQLSGMPADERSEVYSLGLVLYEVYTGKRARHGRTIDELRREHEEGPPSPPSTVLADIDPLVDAMLTRCLARDPAQRPASVLEVARSLPGGDPLAAAIARGQTPAPELVADAEARGSLSPRTALALALGSLALFVALALGRSAYFDHAGISFGKAPAVLDDRAREIYAELAGESAPEYEVHWYGRDAFRAPGTARESWWSRPGHVGFLMRNTRLGPASFVGEDGFTSERDPMPTPGTAHVVLDSSGQLVAWTRWPVASGAGTSAPTSVPTSPSMGATPATRETDWSRLLVLASLDADTSKPIEPDFVPRVFASERRAWEVTGGSLRVEAAALDGRIVQFDLLDGDRALGWPASEPLSGTSSYVILAITAIASFFAWRNVRTKRAYLSGALVVGLFALVTHIVLAFDTTIPTDANGFGNALFRVLALAVYTAARVFVCFLALEPFARRHWPGALISWTRLLDGRFRDPAVGREVLTGIFAGLAGLGLIVAIGFGTERLGLRPWDAGLWMGAEGISSPIQSLCQLFHAWGDTVMYAGIGLALLVASRSVFRRAWLGNVLWFALILVFTIDGQFDKPEPVAVGLAISAGFLWLTTRLGFLSAIAFFGIFGPASSQALTLRPRDWHFASGMLHLLVLAAIVAWSYRAAVGQRGAAR